MSDEQRHVTRVGEQTVIYHCPAGQSIEIGWSRAEGGGFAWTLIVHPSDAELHQDVRARIVFLGPADISAWNVELAYLLARYQEVSCGTQEEESPW